MKESPCTNCGKVNDAATALDGDIQPEPGDVAVCLYCHHLMVYGDGLTLRDPTSDELIDMAGDPDVLRTMRAVGLYERDK